VDFSEVVKRIFSVGTKSGEIWFYPLETKKATFFAKSLAKHKTEVFWANFTDLLPVWYKWLLKINKFLETFLNKINLQVLRATDYTCLL